MKFLLPLIGVLVSNIAGAQITSPGLLKGESENLVLAIASPEVALKPVETRRFLRLYAERTSDDPAVRFHLCLMIEERRRSRVDPASVINFEKAINEKGTQRAVKTMYVSRGNLASAMVLLSELKEATQRELAFTFESSSSQIDVKLPSALASNFLASCEHTFGPLTNSPSSEIVKNPAGKIKRGRISFDTKALPFGEYDSAFLAAVEQAWHGLLESNKLKEKAGTVVCEFNLNSDGRITSMKVVKNEVGELLGMLCQRAIQDPAPYPRWPAEMKRTLGSDRRQMRFTFFYE